MVTKNPLIQKFGLATVGLSRVLANGVTIIYTVVYLRFGHVSVDEIGKALFVMYVLGFIAILTDLGMTEGIQKFINHYEPKKIISAALFFEFGIVTLTALCIFVFDRMEYLSGGYPLLFCLAIVFSLFNLIILIFNGLHEQIKSSIYQILFVVILLSLAIVTFFFFHLAVLPSLLISLVISWSTLIVLMLSDLYRNNHLSLNFSLPREFISFSLNNFIYVICFQILTQSDSFFLHSFFGDSSITIYKSMAQLALASRIIGLAICTPLLPIFARLYSNKENVKAIRILWRSVMIIGLCIVGLFTIFLFWGNPILTLIYDNPTITQTGLMILPFLVWGFGIQSLLTPVVMFMQATNRIKIVRNIALFQATLYVILMLTIGRNSILFPAMIVLVVESLAIPYYLIYFINMRRMLNSL